MHTNIKLKGSYLIASLLIFIVKGVTKGMEIKYFNNIVVRGGMRMKYEIIDCIDAGTEYCSRNTKIR